MTESKGGTIAVISDVHGNLEALHAVLDDIDEQGIKRIVCLGDAIGYGPNPEEVVRLIRRRSIPMVMGNHDEGVISSDYLLWFNPDSKAALQKSLEMLSSETKSYLAALPVNLSLYGGLFVHGRPPDRVSEYLHQAGDEELVAGFNLYEQQVCFVGHCHFLLLVSYDGLVVRHEILTDSVRLEESKRYIVSVGSVGQPRDGDGLAKYVIWNREEQTVEPRRVSYDIEKTVEKINRSGLPLVFADRLWK